MTSGRLITASLVALLCLGGSFGLEYTDCGSKHATMKTLSIDGCSDTKCPLKIGETYNISGTFHTKYDLTGSKLTFSRTVWAFVLTLKTYNVCSIVEPQCSSPNISGAYSFKMEKEIKWFYPTGRMELMAKLRSAEGVELSCTEINFDIIT